MISILLHLVVIIGLGLWCWRATRKTPPIVFGILLVLAYGGLYLPTAMAWMDFESWKSENPAFERLEGGTTKAVRSIYLDDATCSTLCRELLFNLHVDHVVTGSAQVKDMRNRRLSGNAPYVRWSLQTDRETCWRRARALQGPGLTLSFDRGLLAQGVCFDWSFIDDIQADLRVSLTKQSVEAEGRSGPRSVRWLMTAEQQGTGTGWQPVARAAYGAEPYLAFPLNMRINWSVFPPDVRLFRASGLHGEGDIEPFVWRLTGFQRRLKSDSVGPLFAMTRLDIINQAVVSDIDLVRWSAAHAICSLGQLRAERFAQALAALGQDGNPSVQAAAQLADRAIKTGSFCSSAAFRPSTSS